VDREIRMLLSCPTGETGATNSLVMTEGRPRIRSDYKWREKAKCSRNMEGLIDSFGVARTARARQKNRIITNQSVNL
jgi:hypothetical protein